MYLSRSPLMQYSVLISSMFRHALAMEDASNYVNFRGSLISRVSCIRKNISTKILDTRFRALSVDGNYPEAKLLNVG